MDRTVMRHHIAWQQRSVRPRMTTQKPDGSRGDGEGVCLQVMTSTRREPGEGAARRALAQRRRACTPAARRWPPGSPAGPARPPERCLPAQGLRRVGGSGSQDPPCTVAGSKMPRMDAARRAAAALCCCLGFGAACAHGCVWGSSRKSAAGDSELDMVATYPHRQSSTGAALASPCRSHKR